VAVKREPVNVNTQTVLAVIPIVDFWAAYRIQKFRLWCLLYVGLLALNVPIEMVLPYPYGLTIAIIVDVSLVIYLMRKWSNEWNALISSSLKEDKTTSKSPMMLLQERYVRGEITREEFDKMKADLNDNLNP